MLKSSAYRGMSPRKTIAIVLLVISFVFLFLPWMTVSLKVMGQKLTLPKLVNYVSMLDGTTPAEQKNELYDELVWLSDDLIGEGINMDPYRAITMVELIYDGGISPLDAARVCAFSNSLLGETKQYIFRNSQYLYGEEKVIASIAVEAAGKVTVVTVVLWILMIGAIIAFFVSLYLLLTDRKLAVVPFFSFVTILLLLFVFLVLKANHGLNEVGGIVSDGIAGLLNKIGISSSPNADLNIFHVGISAVLCFLFSGAAMALSMLNPRRGRRICPACGRTVSFGDRVCTSCGHVFGTYAPHLRSKTYSGLTPPSEDDLN